MWKNSVQLWKVRVHVKPAPGHAHNDAWKDDLAIVLNNVCIYLHFIYLFYYLTKADNQISF